MDAGIFKSTPPSLTDGGQAQFQLDAHGNLKTSSSDPTTGGSLGSGAVTVSVTRPADTTAYTAGDVIGATTTTGGAVLTLSGLPSLGGEVMLTTVQLAINTSVIPSGMTSFRMHLYNASPASALADNAAWDLAVADRANYLGYVDLGTPVDVGSTLYVESTQVNKQATIPSGGVAYAYIVTNGTYTPSASVVKSATIHFAGI